MGHLPFFVAARGGCICRPIFNYGYLFFLWQLTELQRKENEKKQLLDSAIVMAEKLVNNRLSKQGYLEGEGNNKTKRQKLSAEIESLAACLWWTPQIPRW